MIWARHAGSRLGLGDLELTSASAGFHEGGGGWESVLCLFPTLGARGGGECGLMHLLLVAQPATAARRRIPFLQSDVVVHC